MLVEAVGVLLTSGTPDAVVVLGVTVGAGGTWWKIAASPQLRTPLPGWVGVVVGLPLLAVLGYLSASVAIDLPLAVLASALVPARVLGLPIGWAIHAVVTEESAASRRILLGTTRRRPV